mgnify:FL=1
MADIMMTKNKAGVRYVFQEDGTPTYLLEQQINIEELEWQAKKAQTRYRRDANLKAEQNYLYLQSETGGNRWVLSGTCSCGKHRGVVFYQGDRRISGEALCPIRVWNFWFRKAVREKKWSEFMIEKPLDRFLDNFRIGG